VFKCVGGVGADPVSLCACVRRDSRSQSQRRLRHAVTGIENTIQLHAQIEEGDVAARLLRGLERFLAAVRDGDADVTEHSQEIKYLHEPDPATVDSDGRCRCELCDTRQEDRP
jgi:hypothetical protein